MGNEGVPVFIWSCDCTHHELSRAAVMPPKTCVAIMQVQTGIQIIMDTQPKGGAAAGGTSREEAVDRIAEDLLAKARLPHAAMLLLDTCCWRTYLHMP